MSVTPIRWGISSTGTIAHDFARALARVPDAEVVAVASRTVARAKTFAAEHGIARAHGSHDALLGDPDVDIVYIASPSSEHAREALAAVEAGKHVLVEKPFALSVAQARIVLDAAETAGVFVMEAMWSRFLPAYRRLTGLVGSGAIGEVRTIEASFGFPLPHEPRHRILALELGGGALLDLGVYPVNLAVQLLGPPDHVVATGVIGPTGVDIHTAVAMRFPRGALAVARCSVSAPDPCSATVIGTEGTIQIPPFHHAPEYLIHRRAFTASAGERVELPIGGDGLRHQVADVHACLRRGVQQSDVMSWQHTLDLLTVLDLARDGIGLQYPDEGMNA